MNPLGSLAIRRATAVSVLIISLVAATLTGLAPASAGPGESTFTSRINGERASRGLRSYAVRGDLTTVARRHAGRMASRRSYFHNPNLGSEVGGWQALAENVGKGSDAASLHRAFMNSSSHRRNILSSTYTEVGVGTATDSAGTLYVVQIFRLPTGASRVTVTAQRSATRTTLTRTRVPARASRSGRRVAATPPRRVGPNPTQVLRARLRVATGWRRAPHSYVAEMVRFHDLMAYLAPR